MSIRLVTLQLLLAFAMANARNDAPPSSDRAWSPPSLPNYERDLAAYHSKTAEGGSRISINSRKVYNLAELIGDGGDGEEDEILSRLFAHRWSEILAMPLTPNSASRHLS